ncbi:hypothetical protein [Variovorax sp. E3]|uniref:hypothetical protein n=1 Tax=Variovorax sp. E3 TaxID=1914993 RepID=UPI0018DD9C0B|nr:hypothetical protein [Variovorax sp. E3]
MQVPMQMQIHGCLDRGRFALARHLAGLLALCGFAVSAVIAVRDECPAHAGGAARSPHMSTLAPIMSPAPGSPGSHDTSPPAHARRGALACLYQPTLYQPALSQPGQPATHAPAGRSAKLKPTP